jgi:hypothetical protein
MSVDFQRIKQAAAGRWAEIIAALTPLSAEVLTKGRDDHPCPGCGGQSVIWPANGAVNTGSIACRKCTDNKPTGDGIATVAKFGGMGMGDAARAIASHLGIDGSSEPDIRRDVIAEVCKDKRMPLDAFMLFGPTIEKRGRSKNDVARVPVYNEHGVTHSYFDFAPGQKGWFARGEGMAGMFFPGRLPQPGETWHLVEGCKDAAALIGLGFNAAGLPASCMADKYAPLFNGVHVVFVPDLDKAGQDGAQVGGGRLFGIAASVRVARLPGEVVEKGGVDVRDVLSRQDGEQLVRQAIETSKPWQPREGEQNPKDGRPEVLVTLAYGWVADQVIEHLGKLGWVSDWIPAGKREALKIYQRGGSLVHVVTEDNEQQIQGVSIPAGTARIRPLPVGQLPLRIADACQLVREKVVEGVVEIAPTSPQRWLVEGVATKGDWGRQVRRLEGIVTAPTIRPDGSILQAAGYDEKTGLLLILNRKFPAVPDKPAKQDALQAANLLLEVVKDFPFVDDADRSAWIAFVLSQLGRPAITGCVPLFALTATTRGSGKSLLADAASIIACGRCAPRKTFSKDDNEQRKAITAIALEALPAVLLDNVACKLGGASLDAALTATTWTDRILGASKTTGELPLRTVWAATGNNLSFGSDLARRVLPIRLDPQVENPEERTDFEHCNLLQWIHENRPQLVIAALTVLRAYVVAGCPQQPGGAWGSYESWSDLIRGAIVWAGLTDPLETRQTAKADDESGSIVRGLIGGLREIDDSGEGLTAREIVNLITDTDNQTAFPTMREIANEVGVYKGKLNSKSLGLAFRKYRGRVANDWKIDGEPDRNGVIRWRAVKSVANGCSNYPNHQDYPTSQDIGKPEHVTTVQCHAVKTEKSDLFGYPENPAYPISQNSAGDAGDAGDDPGYPVGKTCVSHTEDKSDTRESYGDGVETHPAYPAYPALATLSGVRCKCGADMVPATYAVVGWRNWDCPKCGRVTPQQDAEQVGGKL